MITYHHLPISNQMLSMNCHLFIVKLVFLNSAGGMKPATSATTAIDAELHDKERPPCSADWTAVMRSSKRGAVCRLNTYRLHLHDIKIC